ncbi:MAG: archease [Euryarchaeota archaeon]|nr:archease [Euryarchaeota archaeon]
MPGYEVFEHTADVGIRAFGKTLPEILENAALGMMNVICDASSVEPAEMCKVMVEGDSDERMLYAWLAELLYLVDTENMLYSKFQVAITDGKLKAKIWGEPIDRTKHKIKMEIKAVTWHMLKLDLNEGNAQVLFDI